MEQPQHVARPTAEQIGAQCDGAHADAAAPIVADEVDETVLGDETLDHTEEPVDVLLLGGAEPVRRRATEPRELWGLDIGARQVGDQRLPDHGGLRVSVEQDDGHVPILTGRGGALDPTSDDVG